ncbi:MULTISPECIES: hypothetical protein [unclassified Ensifer]|uniref:hypothetical protein n=1 Tax=unclassified Ensifer TaxID=2633371 RepID=UPI000712AD47|nr:MULTISPECIES: hypothetical protein [unclassified Ensifer]KQX40909.1 hypothetical protein ASD49_15725 [Ensifer sp. Root1298]KQX70230.1 hypothetical protein ASD41_16800 [Ensifer sp. Root1312]KRC14470.1 hypothetical protein ASE29_17280 [Ensifer sp. Root74]KRD57008.1 hypothetical protein ASE71_10695 [Ensifer sp. Root954]
MNIGESALAVFLKERLLKTATVVGEGSFLNSKLFEIILRGDARLPLDRVEEVALALGCDARQLFRLAARQFYDEGAIRLFERMLGTPMTNEEQMWLHEIRSTAEGPFAEPNIMVKRLVHALVQAGG